LERAPDGGTNGRRTIRRPSTASSREACLAVPAPRHRFHLATASPTSSLRSAPNYSVTPSTMPAGLPAGLVPRRRGLPYLATFLALAAWLLFLDPAAAGPTTTTTSPGSTGPSPSPGAFALSCSCRERAGGCLRRSTDGACFLRPDDCEALCACGADGAGYTCGASAEGCAARGVERACAAGSASHRTGRGMRCACVPAPVAAAAGTAAGGG